MPQALKCLSLPAEVSLPSKAQIPVCLRNTLEIALILTSLPAFGVGHVVNFHSHACCPGHSARLWGQRPHITPSTSHTILGVADAWSMLLDFKNHLGTSLVAQGLRIPLPMQRTRVRSLVREDPPCHRATKPMRHNYWACALEPASHNHWARALQLLKPTHLEPVLRHKEKPPQWEACAPQQKSSPRSPQLEKARAQQRRPNAAKKKN